MINFTQIGLYLLNSEICSYFFNEILNKNKNKQKNIKAELFCAGFWAKFQQIILDILVNVKLCHGTLIGIGISLAPISLSKNLESWQKTLGKLKFHFSQCGFTHPNLK